MNPAVMMPTVSGTALCLRHLLRALFDRFDARGIRYCILHGYDRMPQSVAGDLDLAVHENDASLVPGILRSLFEDGYFLLQHRHYAVHGHRFDLGWFDDRGLQILGLDLIFEFRYAGCIVAAASKYVARRWRNDNIWFANHEDQFAYLLAKRVLKKSVDRRQLSTLETLVGGIGIARSESIAEGLLGQDCARKAVAAIRTRSLSRSLPELLKVLRGRFSYRHPARYLSYWWPEWRRRWGRWRVPTGLLLVVLGPDGCGKNTLIERVGLALREAFRGQYHFHWRPGALVPLKNVDGPEPFPHGRAKRGAALSSIYAAVFQLDYWFGYWLKIYPAMTRSALIFFNRYHYDMQVDSQRYRYGGPRWLIEAFSKCLPGHPLVLILDGDPEQVYRRKPELSIFELQRQRSDYRKLAGRLQNAFVIDANLPPEAVAHQALQVIAQQLHRRNLSNYPDWSATPGPAL